MNPFDLRDENERLWSLLPSQQALDGFDFLFLIAETVDTCYAEQEQRVALKAAGEWYARVKDLHKKKETPNGS